MTLPGYTPQRLVDLGFTHQAKTVMGKQVEYLVPPLCAVPMGLFLMGSDPKRDMLAAAEDWAKNEQPQHSVSLATYQMASYPVTVAEYACFVRAGQQQPRAWPEQLGAPDHPVVSVTWLDAVAYATWLAEQTNLPWRLPTEAEWEKAARGDDGRIYPWGDQFDQRRCNTAESGINTTTPVGQYRSGASPYGVLDMVGNVWEWTNSLYRPYPYTVADRREDPYAADNLVLRGGSWFGDGGESRTLRGGSWDSDAGKARVASRYHFPPDGLSIAGGFRLALSFTRESVPTTYQAL